MKWWANVGKKVSESKQLEAGKSLVKEGFWRGPWYADGLFDFKPRVRKKICSNLGSSGEDQNMAETMKMTGCRSCKVYVIVQ